MDLIAIVTVVSLGPIIGYSFLVWRRVAAGNAAVASGDLLVICVLGVLLGCIVSSVLIQAVLTFAVVSLCIFTKAKSRWVLIGCWLSALLPVLMAVRVTTSLSAHVHELRQKNAFVSLAPRLIYEEQRGKVSGAPAIRESHSSEAGLSERVSRRLADRERFTHLTSQRTDDLRRLHSRYADRFVLIAGFGVGRMSGFPSFAVEPSEKERTVIAMPLEGLVSAMQGEFEPELYAANDATRPKRVALEGLSNEGEQDFLSPERFGYVRDGKVAGFIPHRFSEELRVPAAEQQASSQWQVSRVSLVSLLKFSDPGVYITDELPNMERLAGVPMRPLNAFEREALPKLRTEEDLVVRYSANTIRMLGSLRSGKACLECHSVQRGELLGAFSYELRRTEPVPEPVSGRHRRSRRRNGLAIT